MPGRPANISIFKTVFPSPLLTPKVQGERVGCVNDDLLRRAARDHLTQAEVRLARGHRVHAAARCGLNGAAVGVALALGPAPERGGGDRRRFQFVVASRPPRRSRSRPPVRARRAVRAGRRRRAARPGGQGGRSGQGRQGAGGASEQGAACAANRRRGGRRLLLHRGGGSPAWHCALIAGNISRDRLMRSGRAGRSIGVGRPWRPSGGSSAGSMRSGRSRTAPGEARGQSGSGAAVGHSGRRGRALRPHVRAVSSGRCVRAARCAARCGSSGRSLRSFRSSRCPGGRCVRVARRSGRCGRSGRCAPGVAVTASISGAAGRGRLHRL